jgi:hypothetical protein
MSCSYCVKPLPCRVSRSEPRQFVVTGPSCPEQPVTAVMMGLSLQETGSQLLRDRTTARRRRGRRDEKGTILV